MADNTEELQQQGMMGTFTAVIGQHLGEPDQETLRRLTDVYGKALDPADTFIFPAEASNSLVDSYYTFQGDGSINNYMKDFAEGRSLMLGHAWGDQAIGHTFDSYLNTEIVVPAPGSRTRADIIVPKKRTKVSRDFWEEDFIEPIGLGDWRSIPPPGENIKRVTVISYIPRGLKSSTQVANDDVIKAIITRVYRDVSITFEAQDIKCKLCGRSVLMWECPHIPGCIYDTATGGRVAYAETINGHGIELSFGFEGATPQASVVPAKVRMLAESGRLTKGEASRLRLMEGRLNKRLIDPSAYKRVQTVYTSKKDEGNNMVVVKKGTRATDGSGTQDVTGLEQAVADSASTDAEALANYVATVTQQITDQEAVVAALQTQVDAAKANTPDLVDGLQAQLDAETAHLNDLKSELDSANQQLDAANTLADATGGTSTDASAGTPPASGTTASNLLNRAKLGVERLRTITANDVAPLISFKRDVSADDLNNIIDALNAVITSIQQLVQNAGGTPPATQANTIILRTIANNTKDGQVNLRNVVEMVNRAKDGRDYRESLINDIVAGNGRAYGPSNVNEALVRAGVSRFSIEQLKEEVKRLDRLASISITSGRHVWGSDSPNGNGSNNNIKDEDSVPSNASKASREARRKGRNINN
jgi:hypothetical protein